MIHTFVRHCTRPLHFFKPSSKQSATSLQSLTFSSLVNSNSFKFSTQKQQKPKQSDRQIFSPIDYYRNTIRKVNIRANGRGSFSSRSLQQLVKMTNTQQHAKIMFEAYFNYLGHFTLIPSKVVDSLVLKAIQIGNQTEQLLEIFSHHCYLTYFPHYRVTNKFIQSLAEAKDHESLQKILRIIIRSPLLKIDYTVVDTLLQVVSAEDCDATTREYVFKVLTFRKNLTEGINREDLLAKVASVLEKNEFGPFEAKPMILEHLRDLSSSQSSSIEQTVNRLILISTFGLIDDCSSILARETQQIGSQYDRFFDYVAKLYPRSSQQVNYGSALKEALVNAKLSLEVTEKLQKLANGVSE